VRSWAAGVRVTNPSQSKPEWLGPHFVAETVIFSGGGLDRWRR
jgi:hypothetical protein